MTADEVTTTKQRTCSGHEDVDDPTAPATSRGAKTSFGLFLPKKDFGRVLPLAHPGLWPSTRSPRGCPRCCAAMALGNSDSLTVRS